MQLDNVIEYPQHIGDIKEIKALSAATDTATTALGNAFDSLDNNLFILSSDETGIARREKILGITPQDTDTLDERRYRVWLLWYDTYPYTEEDLRERLTRLCPNGDFTLVIDSTAQTLAIKLGLSNRKNFAAMLSLLEELVPLQVNITVSLLYNQWSAYAAKTWGDVSTKTWTQMKEDVL